MRAFPSSPPEVTTRMATTNFGAAPGMNSQYVNAINYADAVIVAAPSSALSDAIVRVQDANRELGDLIGTARTIADVAFGSVPEKSATGVSVPPSPTGSVHALREALQAQSAMIAELRGQLYRLQAL